MVPTPEIDKGGMIASKHPPLGFSGVSVRVKNLPNPNRKRAALV